VQPDRFVAGRRRQDPKSKEESDVTWFHGTSQFWRIRCVEPDCSCGSLGHPDGTARRNLRILAHDDQLHSCDAVVHGALQLSEQSGLDQNTLSMRCLRWIGLVNSGFHQDVCEAITRGERLLAERQAVDGMWRDYWLKPGSSEDWVSACCGLALARAPRSQSTLHSLTAAGRALYSARRAGGWGFNRDTVPDADSSAWVLRFLSIFGIECLKRDAACLQVYVDGDGHAHTFHSPETAGRWGHAHADVTPVVGMALLATGADSGLIARVRNAVLGSQTQEGCWLSFWWSTNSYATARSLEFLAMTGGIPLRVSESVRRWFASLDQAHNSFEAAQRLVISEAFGEAGDAWKNRLLDLEDGRGYWPSSSVLLVPDKETSQSESGVTHADEECLLSTAMSLMALKSWIKRQL